MLAPETAMLHNYLNASLLFAEHRHGKKTQTKKPNTLIQTPDVHSFPLWPLVCKAQMELVPTEKQIMQVLQKETIMINANRLYKNADFFFPNSRSNSWSLISDGSF